MAADELAAGDTVGDGDGVGVAAGLAVAVSVADGGWVAVAVSVGGGDSVEVGGGDSVEVGFAVGVSGRSGDRVGVGIVAVGMELGDRDGVTDGMSGAPHEMSSNRAIIRPIARVGSRGCAVPKPARVITSPVPRG